MQAHNKANSRPWRVLPHLLLTACLLTAPGCLVHSHQVGVGSASVDDESGRESARQYYFLFGLFRMNDVNAQRMTQDRTSYQIDSWFGWEDLALTPLLLPLTVTSRTVTVSR